MNMVNMMEEVHLTTIKPKNKVLLLAQEISFAKVLACNDKRLRDRGLRRLKKWFMARSQGLTDFTKEDLMRIWKGLFYCMWMSDKPLIQEELAEEISRLVHSFASFKTSLLFVETFYDLLSVEWFGIDQLRLDKFLMMIRRFVRQSFELVARIDWPENEVQQLVDVYQKALKTAPMGLSMHVIEVFCEELAKVSKGELSNEIILKFVTMFACIMASQKDGRLISQITRYVFLHLIRQTELGLEHQEKFSAWKQFGFPGGDLDAAEKIEVESDSDEEISEDGKGEEVGEVAVDARAGRVDVLLPPLDFEPEDLLKVLKELRNSKDTTTKARKTLIQLIAKYENLVAGKYPLGLHKVDLPTKVDKKKEIAVAAKKWFKDEQKLIYDEPISEDEEDHTTLNKAVLKKIKAKRKNNPLWEVSKALKKKQNDVEKRSELNKSWEVSECASKNKTDLENSQKRKSNENISDENILSTSTKKVKLASFTVSDRKDSFLSPVTSTPDNQTKSQNIEGDESTPKVDPANKRKPRSQMKNKVKEPRRENVTSTKPEKVEKILCESAESSPKPAENCNNDESSKITLNTSSTDTPKNNGWGGEWDEPLQEGEYEIFIPNKKYVKKRKSQGLSYPVSSLIRKSAEKITPKNKLTSQDKRVSTPGSQKKVEFNLSANCSQDYREYQRSMKSNKKQLPFDATKTPVQGLLKNSTPSPINPFYKNKLKLFLNKSST